MFNIRPIEGRDLPFVNKLRNEVLEFLHDDTEYTLDQTVEWFKTQKPQWYIIDGITTRGEYAYVGYIRTSKNRFDTPYITPYIGMDLAKGYRGKGFAVPIYKQFLDWYFAQIEDDFIGLEVLGNNIPAFNLYLKLGFEVICCHEMSKRSNGRYIPSVEMSLSKEQWFGS